MKTLLGTNCFPSFSRACAYYKPYLYPHTERLDLEEYVKEKIASDEITIGPPLVKAGQTLIIKDNRYHITE